MSTNDETQTTNTMTDDSKWMDVNSRGQIVYRPRRFHGLSQREGFADYVEAAYWAALCLGLVEELAALPSLEGRYVTEIAVLTRELGERIRARVWSFHDGYGPNLYYGALKLMVEAAKEDVGPTTAKEDMGPTTAKEDVGPTAAKEDMGPTTAKEDVPAIHRRQTMGAVDSMPPMPTSPLLRQTGVSTVSDSEFELGRAAVRDVLAHRIASWSSDISGHPLVAGSFIRSVSGIEDVAAPATVDEDEGDANSDSGPDSEHGTDEDGADAEDDAEAEDGADADTEEDGAEADAEEDAAEADTDEDGAEADAEDGAESDTEEDGAEAEEGPQPAVAALDQNIALEMPLWGWLAILAVFVAWATLVNGLLCRDMECRPLGR